jgi:LysM domain
MRLKMDRSRIALPQFAAPAKLCLALLAAAGALTAFAQNYPITPSQRSTAQQVAQAGVAISELSPTAPDSYTVKTGDTLWAISSLFLQRPWRWPELWGMNLDQIRNPHLIYPGQVLYLDKSGGKARLRVGQPLDGSGSQTIKLSPKVRGEQLPALPIATIPARLIEPFLTEPLIVEETTLNTAPRIVATQEGRVILGSNDLAYVRGDLGKTTNFQVFRPAKPLRDPDTKEILAYESAYLGLLDLVKPGRQLVEGEKTTQVASTLNSVANFFKGTQAPTEEAATMRVTSFKQEINVGDLLMPTPPRELLTYAPRAPSKPIDGKILGIYEGVALAGQNSVVSINRGKNDGLERGNVVAVFRAGGTVKDKTAVNKNETVLLPDERYGYMLVFRVFDRVSYALVLQVENTVQIGDKFGNP